MSYYVTGELKWLSSNIMVILNIYKVPKNITFLGWQLKYFDQEVWFRIRPPTLKT